MKKIAFGVIDAQRGFMPEEEGNRLRIDGFGELPIVNGEAIVPNANRLLDAYHSNGGLTFTTQDWHPLDTAHFSNNPDFKTTWPPHCVANTAGAELHPGIVLPPSNERFIKGMDRLARGEDDNSYSGYYAENDMGIALPDYLQRRGVTEVILGGLAIDYCVGLTAIDFKEKIGLEVVVAVDATKGITPKTTADMLDRFKDLGIQTALTEELLTDIEGGN